MTKATILAERLKRHGFTTPLKTRKEYLPLFRLLQPVSTVNTIMPTGFRRISPSFPDFKQAEHHEQSTLGSIEYRENRRRKGDPGHATSRVLRRRSDRIARSAKGAGWLSKVGASVSGRTLKVWVTAVELPQSSTAVQR